MRWIAIFIFGLLLTGCAQVPTSESEVFDDMIQLTSGFDAASDASFSHDMNWIIFQAIPRGETSYQIYLARLLKTGDYINGIGQAIRVSPQGSINSSGAFSPDGLSVIFASTAGSKEPQNTAAPASMEIFRADAWQGAIAAMEFSRGIDLAKNKITSNEFNDQECSFSPDGKWILFTSNRNADPTRPNSAARDTDVYLMKADGSNVIRLTNHEGYDGSARFSPSGRQILFRSDRDDGKTIQNYLADIDHDLSGKITGIKNIYKLTEDTATHFRACWCPDETHLLYASNPLASDNFDLYMMRTDGSHNLRLTFQPANDVLPLLSPDGHYIMWTSQRSSDHTAQIYIARLKMPAAR